MRYVFPRTAVAQGEPNPAARAKGAAALFLAIPQWQLTVGRLETEAQLLVDHGRIEYTSGDPMGEELAPWLRLVIGPGGRQAFLDVDLDVMAHVQVEAERSRRESVS